MFTGLVSELGTVLELRASEDGLRLTVAAKGNLMKQRMNKMGLKKWPMF